MTMDLNGAPPRRSILLAGGAAAGGLMTSRIARAGRVAGVPDASPTSADWAALRRALSTGDLARPGNASYRRAKQLFDPRFDHLSPAGVAYCATPADVSACLSFARRFALPARPRSGGHSYAGYSSVSGGLIIDVTRMNGFTAGNGTVTVGTGLELINFYNKLAARGLAVPGGSCATVGIAGLTLGGGVGVLSRQFGLTADHLTQVQIVTADGSLLTCNSASHSDLLWACQGGGGGNFGVATSFTFKTRALTHLVLFFLSWPWAQARQVVSAWQSWAPHGPGKLWANLHLGAAFGGAPSVMVGGTYTGSVAGASSLLDQLYAKVGSGPGTSFLSSEPYLHAMLIEAGCSDLTVPECGTGPGGQLARVPSFAKSDIFTRPLSAAGITALLGGIERLGGIAGASGGAGSIAFDALGGAINKVPADATAFVHRNGLFQAQYYTSWNTPGSASGVARQHAWLRSYYADVHPHASGQAYQNYIDPDLTNWRQAYYGANYARLSQIKATYDPAGFFKFPQGITAL